jgi:hypothetical protein
MYEITSDRFPLEDTVCRNCKHHMSKVIIPLEPANYGIDVEEMEIDEGDVISLEIHTCRVTGEDMDHVVLECNKFESDKDIFKYCNPYDDN